MTSPDVAAATYVPEWRSRPIPQPGDHIKMTALVHVEGSHFLGERVAAGIVDTSTLDTGQIKNDLLIHLVDDPTDYILRQPTRACDWALIEARVERAAEVPEEIPAPPAVDPMSVVALERRLLEVQTRLKAIAGEKDALDAEVAVLNKQIRDTALAEGMETLPAVNGMTAYFCPVYYVERRVDEVTGKPYTTRDLLAALREAGATHLITETANGNQVRALVREIVVDHKQPMPPALAAVINLETRYDVRFTPMGEKKRRAAPRNEE